MVVFNLSIRENWKARGYRYVFILPFKKFGVLQPLNHEKERLKGYTINIDELDLIDTSGDYFLTKNKDGVLALERMVV
jgi:hypothetical protein